MSDEDWVELNARQLGDFHIVIAIAKLLVDKGILTNAEVMDAIEARSESIIRGVRPVGDPLQAKFEEYAMAQIQHAKLLFVLSE